LRALLLTACILWPDQGNAVECTRDEARTAETVTDYLDSWDNVFQFFKQFSHCMDGSVAEGAHDRMQQLWVKHWSKTPRMMALINANPEFKAFVLRALRTETFSQDDFNKVFQNATVRCQPIAREFCSVVKQEARRQ
jgi:hypothetical protein